MRFIILLFSFFFTSFTMLAQWEQKADPIFTKDHGIGFSLEGFGYVLTGGKNGQVFTETKDFFKYDPSSDSWEKLPDYPGPARGYGIGDTWNGKLYFGFGQDDIGNALDDLWEWDPTTNIFTELPSCPCDARLHPGFLADNGKVYVGAGGGDAGNLSDFWIYDITAQTWTQIADIPGKRHHPYQFSIDGEIYVGNGHLSSWYKYDETGNVWVKLKNLLGRVAGAQFSYNGKGYVLSGGDSNHDSFDTGEFWEYDPLENTWTALAPHPGTSRFAPTQFVIDNYIYLLGGYYRSNSILIEEETMFRYQLDKVFVGLEENEVSFEKSLIYPNPSDGEINIMLNQDVSENAIVYIYDVMGDLVISSTFKNVLSISNLKRGMYFVDVREKGELLLRQKMYKL